jgi:hypothetical protein
MVSIPTRVRRPSGGAGGLLEPARTEHRRIPRIRPETEVERQLQFVSGSVVTQPPRPVVDPDLADQHRTGVTVGHGSQFAKDVMNEWVVQVAMPAVIDLRREP